MENEITVLFVSYHSDDIIEKSIMSIDRNIKIIVVENSQNKIFKNKTREKILKCKSNHSPKKFRKWSWYKLWNKTN